MNRRLMLKAALSVAIAPSSGRAAGAAEPDHDVTFLNDFDELWETLRDRYCFFLEKRTDWHRVRTLYRPLARSAESRDAFTEVLRRTLAELYDPHTSLADPPAGSPRLPISDLIAGWRGGQAVVTALNADSVAADAGLRLGDVIQSVDGRPIATVIQDLQPRCLTRPDPAAQAYVLNSAVAGRRGQPRRYMVATGWDEPRELVLPIRQSAPKSNVEWRRLDDGIGYIAIRSFADDAVTESFDQALAEFRQGPGLIIDVRDNGGGDTAVARPIMGRFVTETKPYALMRRRQGRGLGDFWTETVEPRGPFTYTRPVVVLTNHWSGSMAEGFPMGMRGLGRATVVGTPMMGLGAAVFPITLDRTGVKAQYSAEPVYDTTGQPRWRMQPDVPVHEDEDVLKVGRRVLASATA